MGREINYERYLQRIGITDKPEVNYQSLAQLQKQHLLNIPFENIDIYYGIPVSLDPDAIYQKIVTRQRGGYCYECNGLFHLLLQWLGFQSRMISCRVVNARRMGPEFDHMALLVTLEGQEWLVDAGFGNFSAIPLLLEPDTLQHDGYADYCIRSYGAMDGSDYFSASRYKAGRNEWQPVYLFTTKGHPLQAFSGMNHYHQTTPNGHFVRNFICSQLTETGRLSLVNNRLITTNGRVQEDRLIYGHEASAEVLASIFGMYNVIPGTGELRSS